MLVHLLSNSEMSRLILISCLSLKYSIVESQDLIRISITSIKAGNRGTANLPLTKFKFYINHNYGFVTFKIGQLAMFRSKHINCNVAN